jgi:cytochrome c-type biogenesis protein CcmH/NrfF
MADLIATTLEIFQWVMPIALVAAATIPMIIRQNRSKNEWLNRLKEERRQEARMARRGTPNVDKPPT